MPDILEILLNISDQFHGLHLHVIMSAKPNPTEKQLSDWLSEGTWCYGSANQQTALATAGVRWSHS